MSNTENKNKYNLFKLPFQSKRRREGMGMAKISRISIIKPGSNRGRLKRVSLSEPIKVRQSVVGIGKKARWLWIAPVFLGLVSLFIYVYFFSVRSEVASDQGLILGVAEERVADHLKYFDQVYYLSANKNYLGIQALGADHQLAEKFGESYLFEAIFPNTNILTQYSSQGIKQKLLFTNSGHPLIFQYLLYNLANYDIVENNGNIMFSLKEKSASNVENFIHTIAAPYAEDNTGRRSFLAVNLQLQDDVLLLSIDPIWLEQAVYPVFIDFNINHNKK